MLKIDVDELRNASDITRNHAIQEKHDNPKYLKCECNQGVIPGRITPSFYSYVQINVANAITRSDASRDTSWFISAVLKRKAIKPTE